jgi:hypothetical protein
MENLVTIRDIFESFNTFNSISVDNSREFSCMVTKISHDKAIKNMSAAPNL